jgi:hypothetical protein
MSKSSGLRHREDLEMIKGKVVLVLFLTEHHAMKAYWGSGGTASHTVDVGTICR